MDGRSKLQDFSISVPYRRWESVPGVKAEYRGSTDGPPSVNSSLAEFRSPLEDKRLHNNPNPTTQDAMEARV